VRFGSVIYLRHDTGRAVKFEHREVIIGNHEPTFILHAGYFLGCQLVGTAGVTYTSVVGAFNENHGLAYVFVESGPTVITSAGCRKACHHDVA
jgi:hypothetical protein